MKKAIIRILPLLMVVMGLASCLKEAPSFNPDDSNNVVEFANTGVVQHYGDQIGFNSDLGTLQLNDTASFNVNVSYSGAKMAPSDITVTLDLDQSLLTGTGMVMPPAEMYSFPKTVVIKKGTQVSQIKVTIKKTPSYDFTVDYALPIVISSTSGNLPISGNFGKALYAFSVRNLYDGVYSMKGYVLRATDDVLTGHFKPIEMDLKTLGASGLQFGQTQIWATGGAIAIGAPILKMDVKPNAAVWDVTVTNNDPKPIYNDPAYHSRYDVATKTFYISFTWGAGPSARLATDTLTFLRARD